MESVRKKRRMEASEPRVVRLSKDVISVILSTLPVKTLLRFRCVAKSWSSLIISPPFVKTHLSLSLNNKEQAHDRVMAVARPRACIADPEIIAPRPRILEECTLVSLFHDDMFEEFRSDAAIDLSDRLVSDGLLIERAEHGLLILGSVDGLVGLIFWRVGLFLWNPTTRKFNVLAYPNTPLSFSSSHSYGFGYDRFQDDYKMVATFVDEHETKFELKMYSLNSDSWKTIVANEAPLLTGFGKFVDGKLHWPSALTENGKINFEDWRVVSLDLATEEWGIVEQPTYGEYEYVAFHLGVLKNNLAIFRDFDYTHIDVWILKEYGVRESWTKLCVVKYPEDLLYDFDHLFSLPSFLLSYRDEILVMIDSEPKIYNLEEEPSRPSSVIDFYGDSETQIYVESLVSPFPREDAVIPREDAAKTMCSIITS